jgi:ubiquinone/menaquinone biosynthesis C-methylase UbiE
MSRFDLPYFDQIIDRLDGEPSSEVAAAFKRHVHWGYFATPETSDTSLEGYVVAAEAMTQRVCTAAGARDGLSILDVGCGFGGTIDHLNRQLDKTDFVGLNIDGRQLARARQLVEARPNNTVEFVEGDACDLPFADRQFDVVLAVECAFHFRSRKQFLREVARVTKPGGALALTDFVLPPAGLAPLTAWMQSSGVPESDFYGPNRKPLTAQAYDRLGRSAGFLSADDENITTNTLPTYPAMRRLYNQAGLPDGEAATTYLEELAVGGFMEYHVIAFRRPA